MIAFGLLMFLAVLGGLVLAYVGFFASQRLRRDVDRSHRHTRDELAQLRRDLDQHRSWTDEELSTLRADMGLGRQVRPEQEDVPDTPASEDLPLSPTEMEASGEPETASTPEPKAPMEWVPPAATRRADQPAKSDTPNLEEALASRWLVWLGAVAMALGGAFLVKYSIDQGLLGPEVRLTIAMVVGIALIAAGEWLRRAPLHEAVMRVRPDYVPPSLSAAGVVTIFGAIYAAYGLHGFLGSTFAFVGLGAAAMTALALSLLQGPLIAAIGLVGAFLTPLLVTTTEPSAWGLLGYLLFVLAASLSVLRYRNWWWLATIAVTGSFLWGFVFFAFGVSPEDTLPGFVYLAGLIGLPVLLARPEAQAFMASRSGLASLRTPDGKMFLTVVLAVLGADLLALMFFDRIGFGTPALIFLAALAAAQCALGRRYEGLSAIALLGGGLVLAALAMWPVDFITTDLERLTDDQSLNTALSGFAFYNVLACFAAGFGLFGFFAAGGARRAGRWASLSAALPLALMSIGYLKHIEGRDLWGWPFAAMVLSLFLLGAAERMRRRQGSAALAAYAAGVLSATTLALVFALQDAWLTVALSLQLPVIAWVYGRFPIPAMRPLSLLLAGLVLVRLIFNWNILGYALSPLPIVNWVLYGYGIPALAFYWASKRFRQDKDDLLVQVLEGGACAFAVSLVTLQIHHWVNDGDLAASYFTFFEVSLQTAAWSVLCVGAYWREARHHRQVLIAARKLLFALASVQVIVLHLVALNPLIVHEWVGSWPILNGVLLGFGAPAVAAAAYAAIAHRRGALTLSRRCAGAALSLMFVMVSLQVRQYFNGAFLDSGEVLDAEMYALSVFWILFALVLLALGLRFNAKALRQASFVVILLSVAKVFIIDMSQLEGLLRVLSFFGLGLSLVGISYVYQRYALMPKGSPPEAPNSA